MADKEQDSKYKAGKYEGGVLEWGIKSIGENNTPALEVRLQVDKAFQATVNKYDVVPEPFTAKVTVWLTEGAFTKADSGAQLRALGFTGVDLRQLDPTYAGAVNLKGNRVPLRHGTDKYDWKIVTEGAGKYQPMESDTKAATEAAIACNKFLVKPEGVADVSQPSAPAPNDDEIPF